MQGQEDQWLDLLFPLLVVKLSDLDNWRGNAEGWPTPTGGRAHWQDLTSVTTQSADVDVQSFGLITSEGKDMYSRVNAAGINQQTHTHTHKDTVTRDGGKHPNCVSIRWRA